MGRDLSSLEWDAICRAKVVFQADDRPSLESACGSPGVFSSSTRVRGQASTKVWLIPELEEAEVWLRPKRTYTAGRGSSSQAVDYLWDGSKTIPRKLLEWNLSAVNNADVSFSGGRASGPLLQQVVQTTDIQIPTYTLSLSHYSKQALIVERADGSKESLPKETPFDVQHGDAILVKAGTQLRPFTFQWRPVLCLYAGNITDANLEKFEQMAARERGVRIAKDMLHPQTTHWLQRGDLDFRLELLAATVVQAHIVDEVWMTDFLTATALDERPGVLPEDTEEAATYRVQHAATIGSDPQYSSFSPLERDSKANWPDERSHLPPWSEPWNSDFVKPERWAPNEARRTMFHGILVIAFDQEKDRYAALKAVIERGGGKVINLRCIGRPADQVLAEASKAVAASSKRNPLSKTFCMVDVPDETAMPYQISKKLGGVSRINVAEFVFMLYESKIDRTKYNAQADQPPTPASEAGPSQTPQKQPAYSMGVSQMGDSLESQVPCTNPFESTCNAPSLEDPLADSAAAIAPIIRNDSEPVQAPKKKLVRRAGKKEASFDPFDVMTSSMQTSLPPESQLQSQSSVSAVLELNTAESAPKTLRKSTLKRRVGQQKDLDLFDFSQAPSEMPPAKRTRQADQEMAPPAAPKRKAEPEEVQEARKRVKRAEQVQENKKELERLKSEQAEKLKRMTTAEIRKMKAKTVKTSAMADDAEEDLEATKEKFLHVDYGRRKVSETEQQFAKEFNALKIAKPVKLALPHKPHAEKDSWRGMDRQREDDEDPGDWAADTGKSFFVLKSLPLSARKESTPQLQESIAVDPRWAGLPNFKRFRPKNTASVPATAPRPPVRLVAVDHGGTQDEENHPDDLESSSEDELLPKFATAKLKGKSTQASKATASRSTASQSRAKNPEYIKLSDEEDEQEASVQSSETWGKRTGRKTAAQATLTKKNKGKARAVSEDDTDSEGITFKGFGPKTTGKRKR